MCDDLNEGAQLHSDEKLGASERNGIYFTFILGTCVYGFTKKLNFTFYFSDGNW